MGKRSKNNEFLSTFKLEKMNTPKKLFGIINDALTLNFLKEIHVIFHYCLQMVDYLRMNGTTINLKCIFNLICSSSAVVMVFFFLPLIRWLSSFGEKTMNRHDIRASKRVTIPSFLTCHYC
jgi:hypothetical protein